MKSRLRMRKTFTLTMYFKKYKTTKSQRNRKLLSENYVFCQMSLFACDKFDLLRTPNSSFINHENFPFSFYFLFLM